MPASYDFHTIEVSEISISEDRQRKELVGIDKLADSITRNGLLHPIIITRTKALVAGERRLRAFQQLGIRKIPVHYLDEINPNETKAIELEENIKRVDLPWQDTCRAVLEYDNLCTSTEEDWTQKKTAEAIGFSEQHVSKLIRVGRALVEGDSNVSAAGNIEAAYNVICRRQRRVVTTELSAVNFAGGKSATESKDLCAEETKGEIINDNFLEWSKSYSGRKFNFIHCDFPYGLKYDKTTYGGSDTWEKYEDSPEIFLTLLESFSNNFDRFTATSAHVMFWLSLNNYQLVLDKLTDIGLVVNPFPLIWHKDRGIIPDPKRGPRRVYETALFASRNDRFVIRSVANAHYSKVDKDYHISTKPQEMLKHFFSMFVDDMTEILDPTCGSGTSLAAAKTLGARRILGMDIDSDHVQTATVNLRKARRQEDEQSKA